MADVHAANLAPMSFSVTLPTLSLVNAHINQSVIKASRDINSVAKKSSWLIKIGHLDGW